LRLGGFDLSLTGFGELELDALLAEKTQGRTDPDDVPPPPEHPVSQPGKLWLLDRHRLLCGDSTLAGVEPHLMVTDPTAEVISKDYTDEISGSVNWFVSNYVTRARRHRS
jgi:hypothetical protein